MFFFLAHKPWPNRFRTELWSNRTQTVIYGKCKPVTDWTEPNRTGSITTPWSIRDWMRRDDSYPSDPYYRFRTHQLSSHWFPVLELWRWSWCLFVQSRSAFPSIFLAPEYEMINENGRDPKTRNVKANRDLKEEEQTLCPGPRRRHWEHPAIIPKLSKCLRGNKIELLLTEDVWEID